MHEFDFLIWNIQAEDEIDYMLGLDKKTGLPIQCHLTVITQDK